MSRSERPIGEYLAALASDGDETRFLRSVPWVVDAGHPPVESLIKGLRLEAMLVAEFPRSRRFSLLVPLHDASPEHLRQLILSVRCQSHGDWELILLDHGSAGTAHLAVARLWAARDPRITLKIVPERMGRAEALNAAYAASSGDFAAILDADGILHPATLSAFARHVQFAPETNFLFANEAEIDPASTFVSDFLLKLPLDLFTLLRAPYVGRPYAASRALLESVATEDGPFRPAFDGAEEHDLLLRLALAEAIRPLHVPLFCYYRRKPLANVATRPFALSGTREVRDRLLTEFVPRVYPGASWEAAHPAPGIEDGPAMTHLKLRSIEGAARPKLLIIVPFKDHAETTLGCVESIAAQEHDLDVIVALADNRSAQPETLPRLRRWIADHPGPVRYEIFPHDGAFNYARINNAAISRFGGDRDLLLFLNNDVELTSPDALQAMATQLMADRGAGIVGIKLYYPGGDKIQHGGVRLAETSMGSGYHHLIHAQNAYEFVHDDRLCFCVTFACAMTRAGTFRELDGLDEVLFPNSFGDVDMCARAVEKGYRNYYFGGISGVHHESKSRGFVTEELELSALMERHASTFARWRLRGLMRTYQHAWPILAFPRPYAERPSPADFAAMAAAALPAPPPQLPLRYRLADRAALLARRGMGPAYRPVRVTIGNVGHALKRAGGLRSIGANAVRLPWRVVKLVIAPIPVVGPAGREAVRAARRVKASLPKLRAVARDLRDNPDRARLYGVAWREGGTLAVRGLMHHSIPALRPADGTLAEWIERSRPDAASLRRMRGRRWPAHAPKFTVLTAVYNVREDWLREAVEGVLAQTYPHWELVLVNDGSPEPHIRPTLDELALRDPRIRVIHGEVNRGVSRATNFGLEAATGDYVAFMDHDDYLEPHALDRFAESVLEDAPDMLYSDEAITGPDLKEIYAAPARQPFSYDYYLNHPYFVHLIAVRTDLLRRVGGLNESMTISQDVDLVLRLIEVCRTIAHVPEVLYRWRTHPGSLGHQQMDRVQSLSRGALQRHLDRIGVRAEIDDASHFNFRDIQFHSSDSARVAILIPDSGRDGVLGTCLEGLERTIAPGLADVVVLRAQPGSKPRIGAHESSSGRRHVVASGPCATRSELLNLGARAVAEGGYTHYLLLDEAVEALSPGWLEHMLGYGQRADVGIVGATLVSPDERIVHSGLVIGPDGSTIRPHEGQGFRISVRHRHAGYNGQLLASRDVTAVSAACLLIRADLFAGLSGLDDRLGLGADEVDLCLRARARGLKVLQDAHAVLCCHEARAVAPARTGDHSAVSLRHRGALQAGDPSHSPLLRAYAADHARNPLAAPRRGRKARVVRVVLPGRAGAPTKTMRRDGAEAGGLAAPARPTSPDPVRLSNP